MKNFKNLSLRNKIIVIAIVIAVIIGSILLGMTAAGYFSQPKVEAQGLVISENGDSALLTSYEDYTKLMEKYEVSNYVILTNGSFEENDYLVDFVRYKSDLEIKGINLDISDTGLKIVYSVNKEIKRGNKYLMYFIPIEKGLIQEKKEISQEFSVK